MRLKLTHEVPHSAPSDVILDADLSASVGDVARWFAVRQGVDPNLALSLAVRRSEGHISLNADSMLGESGLRSGDSVVLVEAPTGRQSGTTAVTVRVVAGPDVGHQVTLSTGHMEIGRDPSCGLRLSDPLVSQRHARLVVSDRVEVVDQGSSNGTYVGGQMVSRSVIESGSEIVVGTTTLLVHTDGGGWSASRGGAEPFNRSPWLDPRYGGVKLKAPEPPQKQPGQPFPIMMMVIPLLMAGAMFLVTRNAATIAFMAMSPFMALGMYFENKRSQRRQWTAQVDQFHASMADLVQQMQAAMEQEQQGRRHEHPSTEETLNAAGTRHPMLWCRRGDRPGFLELRLGLGTMPSRNEIETPSTRNTTPELWAELTDVTARFSTVERVPVVGELTAVRALGVAGSDPARIDAARGLVVQLAALHSPADLSIAAIVPSLATPDWEWLKWLPHVDSDHSPVSGSMLASNEPAAAALLAAVSELIEARSAVSDSAGERAASGPLPAVVVIVDEDAPYERARLNDIAERGPSAGVYTLWLGKDRTRLPSVCGVFLEVDAANMQLGTGLVTDGSYVAPVEVGFVNAGSAMAFARSLAAVTDVGALVDDASDLPRTVSFAGELGPELLSSAGAVLDRWKQSFSVSSEPRPERRAERSLRSFVGMTTSGPLMLDLRTHGPHALVGGTTGSGKSEFLQSWLLGMAVGHSPERINFLLVDYKGGAAFGECAELPHSVGLVTDLNTRLVRRALTSLRAELTYREHVLQAWRAKDLLDLEHKESTGAPILPSLIIVVDEFAALVQEIPEFVDGMIDIAQRGRSLGLHLVLATQRPSGVIKGNLRANTNLRVALRVADEEDSDDVVGSKIAATFGPETPGRAVAKLGPGKLTPFQSAYVGGWTTSEPPEPRIEIAELPFGVGREWDAPPAVQRGARDPGPKDITRLCGSIGAAFAQAGMEMPRRPWMPELAERYELSRLPTKRLDSELVFAVADDPERQSQVPAAFEPDRDGNLIAFGSSGSGRTTLLRTIAIASGLAVKGGPCVVYGIDAAGRGLEMLERLPHVGSIIAGDDDERIRRLLSQIRSTIDQRLSDFAGVKAGSITEYRELAGRPDEPRVLLVIDGLGNFVEDYDTIANMGVLKIFESLLSDGRSVGVHVVAATDRVQSVRPALLSSFPARLVLRLTDEMDLLAADLPKDAFDETSPAGRGYLGGVEVQVAMLTGEDASVNAQSQAIGALAVSMGRTGRGMAPPIQRLPTEVLLAQLPSKLGAALTFGLSDDTLGPVGFIPEGLVVITGPKGSGSTTALNTFVAAASQAAVYLGVRRSGVSNAYGWTRSALGGSAVAELADAIATEVEDGVCPEHLVVVESIQDLADDAEHELRHLFNAARRGGICVLIEGEIRFLSQSYGLAKDARGAGQVLALKPDADDLETLSGLPSSRINSAQFPPGRGFWCLPSGCTKVQVAQTTGERV